MNGEAFPDQFGPVMPDSGLEDEKPSRAEDDGVPILLVRRGDRLFAMAETCSHFGAPLSEGKLVGDGIVCPWHASRFGLEDGSVINGRLCIPSPAWKFAYAMDRLKCANIWTVLPSRHRSVRDRSRGAQHR
jgi:nitrite reductase/ring-hydroxylating ferredoxin subunit